MVLRPDEGKFYQMWYGDPELYTTDEIIDFALSNNQMAFTGGELALLRKHS